MNNKLLFGKDETQRVVSIEVNDGCAEIFTETNEGVFVDVVKSQYWMLAHNPVWKNNIKLKGNLYYKYAQQYDSLHEYLIDKKMYNHGDLYMISDAKEAFMVKYGYTYYKGMTLSDISTLSFDIETTGLDHNKDARLLLISNTFRCNGEITRKLFDFKDYEDEGVMIEEWCKWVRDVNPSIILGHNIFMFDIPYIQFIANKFDVEFKLGRDDSNLKMNPYESKKRKDATQFYHYRKCKVYGRELVDTLFLALDYDVGRKYESYGLKSIIKHERLEVKDRQFYDASKIRFNYNNEEEWKKIKQYALHDADDALALFDLMAPASFYFTQMVPKPFQSMVESATGSKINSIMVRSYLQEGHSVPKASEAQEFEGAISIGNPGIYHNVFKVDVASLYPSIMIQYEVYDKDKDPKGNFLELVKTLTSERLKNKKLAKETGNKSFTDMEQSQKIGINSAYGFMGSTGLLFNSPHNAAFITQKGREILQKAIDWSTSKGFLLANADTDSISFYKADQSEFSKVERSDYLVELNSLFPERIKWEDDGYYKTVICIKAKNYILETEEGKVKYKGSAIKATTKEKALQQYIQDIIDSILSGKRNYIEIYNKYVKEILDIKDIKRWSSKKTITDKVLNAERTNELKVKEAIEDSEYKEGDKIYVYFDEEDNLKLAENFDGKYNRSRLLEKLYKTSMVFSTIIPKETFPNYKLKKNVKLLELI